jgi:hypothetical protein
MKTFLIILAIGVILLAVLGNVHARDNGQRDDGGRAVYCACG